ncbi:hypothetical protein [Trinickia dinghuensis]|uniref:Uncharacterized protein n=1 Tax=Trinickia dinghuensis TaxID=2291023 RepID=A0A3D8JZ49_9BURK|nr:hypothetical protein [Trinickia dinghuensis]RDU97641.1 hypothetical protein DWV00_17360 [Trinickia dinghuensis]
MNDFEQTPRSRQLAPVRSGTGEAEQDLRSFRSFAVNKHAMRKVLKTIASEREKSGHYRNPWAGLSDENIGEYTDRVIDRLRKLQERDLSVAQAIYLEGKEAQMRPQERIDALQNALKTARKRGNMLQGDAKASNGVYQEELEREIAMARQAFESRAGLLGNEREVSRSNVGTLLLANGEKPGSARVYMTVYAPSSSEKYKDLRRGATGRIIGVSDSSWLNFGSPARALSYAFNYRLQKPNRGESGPLPLIRSALIPVGFLREHFPNAVTEEAKERRAIENGARSTVARQFNRRQLKETRLQDEPLLNVDVKYPNQFGLKKFTRKQVISVDAKRHPHLGHLAALPHWLKNESVPSRGDTQDFRATEPALNPVYQALFDAVDHDSFTTYSDPAEYVGRHDQTVDGSRGSMHDLASSIGLAFPGERFAVNLLRGGDNAATVFSMKKGDDWKSPSNDELGQIVDDANRLFDALDRLSSGDDFEEQVGYDDLRRGLGNLLDANRLTPGGLLSSREGLHSRLRDRYGNAAVKAAFEDALADRYLRSDIWRREMTNWSGSLANYIRNGLNKEQRNKLYGNPYVERDMQALNAGQPKGQERSADEALDAWSELLRKKRSHGGSAIPERQIALFFHLLRALYPFVPAKQLTKLGGAPFAVNNRVEATDAFEVMNPLEGPYGWPGDRMESTKRFKPDLDKRETELMRELDAPFIGGVSGTTRDISQMMTAVFGNLNADAFWRFQLLNASFMVKSRYHSMFETLYPASFYEKTRGDLMRRAWQARRNNAKPSNHAGLYKSALRRALGKQGVDLWRAALELARSRAAMAHDE